ncbi:MULTISPECIES: hypothetical protein [unclassified Geodermatophilus]
MSLEQDVTAARGAVDALERACALVTRHFGDTLDSRRLRVDVARLRDDLDLLCGARPRGTYEPFAIVYGDGDDEGLGGSGRTRR